MIREVEHNREKRLQEREATRKIYGEDVVWMK